MTLADIMSVYQGSNGDATSALYRRLETIGPRGIIAVNLFRACKSSERAKVYRGGGYRGMAYDRKQWSMGNLCTVMGKHDLGTSWGWALDQRAVESGSPHRYILYVEIPTGQVSFHNADRLAGPDYLKPWDGIRRAAAGRICQWCAQLLDQNNAGSNVYSQG